MIIYSKLQMLNSYDCFFFAFSLQVYVSTHWKTNNLSTTYWNTSLDGSSAQQFRLFLHCGLFTGIHIHTLRCKEKTTTYCHTSLHGLIAQRFWLFFHCILFTGMHIHTLRCKDEDHHILSDSVWWVQCWTATDVSGLSCAHRYMRPHIHRQTKTPSHIDSCRLMQFMMNTSMCLFF